LLERLISVPSPQLEESSATRSAAAASAAAKIAKDSLVSRRGVVAGENPFSAWALGLAAGLPGDAMRGARSGGINTGAEGMAGLRVNDEREEVDDEAAGGSLLLLRELL
jgi:hypothetical protein